jgi:hypothetical protein
LERVENFERYIIFSCSKGVGAVTPGEQPISGREQQSSKKKREEQKRTMEEYFGKGDRV